MLGNQIKQHRLALKLTQEQLAAKLDIDTNTVSRLECGSHLPSLERLEQLSAVLGVSVGNLLGEISSNSVDQAQKLLGYLEGLSLEERSLILEIAKKQSDFFRSHSRSKK